MPAEQLQFPFPSLDFPGRSTLSAFEVAEKLGVSDQHILNLAEEGSFPGLELKGAKATKRALRIPIESYREFIVSRMTGPARNGLLRQLPRAALRDLHREIGEWLRTA
jgi:predicted DNA-binding transcriptional regulator AlpA